MQNEPACEKDLQELRQAFKIQLGILDSADDFIVACDKDLKITYTNSGAYRMAGYTVEEAGLDLLYKVIPDPDALAAIGAALQEAMRHGAASAEGTLLTKDGKKIEVLHRYFPIHDDTGRVFGAGMMMRDLSELYAYRRDVLTKAAIIDSSDDFIAATDKDLHYIYANPGAYALSGYTPEETADLGPALVRDPATARQINQARRDVIEKGITWQGESDFIRKDGRVLTTMQKLFPLRDERGAVSGTGTIIRDISAIKGAQQEADNMLGVLKNILNGMDANVYVSDLATDEILFVNRRMKESFGLEDNSTGQTCWRVMQRGFEARCSFCPIYKLEKDPDTPVEWEIQNTVTGRYYRNVDSIIDWVDGKKAHLQYAIDLTEIKEAQQEADNMLEVLKNILNGMDSYIYVSDLETDEILFINNKMRTAFGINDSAVGQTCWKVFQKGFTERCSFCPSPRLMADPTAHVVWEEHNTLTGSYYKNVDSVIEWKNGKKAHMQHSTDITDILEAQQATRRAHERLEMALTSSQAGVWEMDFVNDQFTCDSTCVQLFGFEAPTHVMPIATLTAHLKKVLVGAPGAAVIDGLLKNDPYPEDTSRDLHLSFANGTQRYLRNFGKSIRDAGGAVRQVVGMCIDVTPQMVLENDMKTAKEAAENANRAKSQFLSNMSHEIRTPMNAITGMADLLMEEQLDDKQHAYVRDIKVASASLLDIINDILDFSKIEAGKLQLIPVDYDSMELLRNLHSMFAFAAKAKGISFEMEIEDPLPAYLYGDDLRLRQALVNILGNAVKFTETGGVRLTVHIDGNMLCFDVADTGVGIKQEDLALIYRDFSQLDSQNNRHIGGTGLGLSITKNLLAMMGGSISAQSEYGKGTTFYLRVPLVPGKAPVSKAAPDGEEAISAPGASVLLVDDNEMNLHVAGGMLARHDIRCDTALSGGEAIQMIQKKKYDIVFMDHMMPRMDGVEATRILRGIYGEEKLPIIALTANAIEGVKEVLLEAGMNDYLSKPMDKEQLNRVLDRWLPPEKKRYRTEVGTASSEAVTAPSPALRDLAQVGEFDVALGLKYSGNMPDVYEKAIRILARRLPESVGHLEAFLASGDAKGFAIEVHGLKGSLANLGATGLSKMALALEMQAKEGALAQCRKDLPKFAGKLHTLTGKLNEVLAKNSPQAAFACAGNAETLRTQLVPLRDLLDSFEGDEALERLQELAQYDYGAPLNGKLQALTRKIEEFDFDGALALLDAF